MDDDDDWAGLSERQRTLVEGWVPGARPVRDLGWGLVESVVLEVEGADGAGYVVKADGPSNHHVPRELDAHERWLGPWVREGRAPRLVGGDREASVLVTEHLDGELVLGHPAQADPDTFRQAGRLLALLHGQPLGADDHAAAATLGRDYEATENAKVLRNLDKPHRLDATTEARLRDAIGSWPTEPVRLVPTHGDWQPRNWLVHDGRVAAIDLGRAALRPAQTDWLRLAARDFRTMPAFEAAFVEGYVEGYGEGYGGGYGGDPRDAGAWWRERVREAVNTAVWAHGVGDGPFEEEGHAMLARAWADAESALR